MKIYKGILLIFGFSIGLLEACEKPLDKDEVNPVVQSLTVNGLNTTLVVQKNAALDIRAQFTDEKELQKYRIRIVDKFYGSFVGEPFNFEEVKPLAGKTAGAVVNILIPDTALAGHFEVVAEAMDKEGNISIPAKVNLQVTQSNLPKITIDLSKTDFIAGDTLLFNGFITISTDLDLIYFDIVENRTLGEKVSEEQFTLTEEIIKNWSVGELKTQNRPIIIPSNANRGKYLVNVAAYDSLGNMSLKTFNINVAKNPETFN